MNGEPLLVADVGEVEHHGQPQELVAPLVDGGTPSGDDGFREVVAHRHTLLIEGYGSLAVDDESG